MTNSGIYSKDHVPEDYLIRKILHQRLNLKNYLLYFICNINREIEKAS